MESAEDQSFPSTERGWDKFAEKCALSVGKLNEVRNLVTPLQKKPTGDLILLSHPHH